MKVMGREGCARAPQRARSRASGLVPFAFLVGSLLVLGGCAASQTRGPRLPVPSDDSLPGAGRALPSEENQVPATAPPAFPDYPADLSSGGGPDPAPGSVRATPSGTVPAGPDGRSGALPTAPGGTTRTEPRSTAPMPPAQAVSPAPARPPVVRPSETFYTVQLQVASTTERAKEWQERAATIFRVPVRVDVESGLHKLRVGMFTTQEGAEAMRRDAVGAGYVDALVVSIAGAVGHGGPR